MKKKQTKIYNDHFNKMIELDKDKVILGSYSSYSWQNDPKHLVFSLARYKFVSKILNGKNNVLEIGAGDGFKSKIVDDTVKKLDLCDVTRSSKNEYDSYSPNKNKYFLHDFIQKPTKKKYDAIYSLDVIEHINKNKCNRFVKNMKNSLKSRGVLIVGTPSLSSQKYASKYSKKFHVNCFDKNDLHVYMNKYFANVFTFGMNDEVVHTGYDKMCHYIFAICIK